MWRIRRWLLFVMLATLVVPAYLLTVPQQADACGPWGCYSMGGINFDRGTNGCFGPVVGVTGEDSLAPYILQTAADYCNYQLASGTDPSSAIDVEWSDSSPFGTDISCAGVAWAYSNTLDNEVGVSDVHAQSCNTAGAGFSFPPNPVSETTVAVGLVEAITHCSGASVPQGGAPGYTTGECEGSDANGGS